MDKNKFLDPFARRNNIPKIDPLPDLPPAQETAEEVKVGDLVSGVRAEAPDSDKPEADPNKPETPAQAESKKPQFAPGINNNTSLGMKAALAIAFGEKQAKVEGTIIERQPFPNKIQLEKPLRPPTPEVDPDLGLTKEQMLKLKEIFGGGAAKKPAPERKPPGIHPALQFRPGAAGNLDQLNNDFLSKPVIRAWEDE